MPLPESEAIPYAANDLRGERLLVLAPHPDDEVIGCGGLLALHLRDGRQVRVVIAYEPIWAIGTGRNATGAMVAEMVRDIREAIARFWPARHRDAAILYGGSVTPDNIDDLGAHGRINGYLVGGASLDCLKFSMICEGIARLPTA